MAKASKVISTEEMMGIFHDPQNIPITRISNYYNLIVDIFGNKIPSDYIIAEDFIKTINASCDTKTLAILTQKYGLENGTALSLKAVGHNNSLSRERIRQIIDDILKILRKKSSNYVLPKRIQTLEKQLYSLKCPQPNIKEVIFNTPIKNLNLSVRAYNGLRKANILTLGSLVNLSYSELLAIKHIGKLSAAEIKEKISSSKKYFPSSHDIISEHPFDDLELSSRSYNVLRRAGFSTLQELLELSEDELYAINNLGKKSVNEILEKLKPYRELKL